MFCRSNKWCSDMHNLLISTKITVPKPETKYMSENKIAKNSGGKVIVMNFNLSAQRLHKYYGINTNYHIEPY